MSEAFKSVKFELLKAPVIPAHKYRNWLSWYGLFILLVLVLGITVFKHHFLSMALCCNLAISLYVVGYRAEKKYLRTFTKIGKLTLSSAALEVETNATASRFTPESIQRIEVKKDRPAGSILLPTRRVKYEYSYTFIIHLKNKQTETLYVTYEPAFGYWESHKNLIAELERLRASDYNWYRLIFIDDDIHDVTTL